MKGKTMPDLVSVSWDLQDPATLTQQLEEAGCDFSELITSLACEFIETAPLGDDVRLVGVCSDRWTTSLVFNTDGGSYTVAFRGKKILTGIIVAPAVYDEELDAYAVPLVVQRHRFGGLHTPVSRHLNKVDRRLFTESQWSVLQELGTGRLELPRGFIKPGESLEMAALREAREEIGLVVTDDTVVTQIGIYEPQADFVALMVPIMHVDNVEIGEQPSAEDEGITDRLCITGEQMTELVRRGVICDGNTLAAIAALLSLE